MMQNGSGSLGRHKCYLARTIRLLADKVYNCLAHLKPYLLHLTIIGSLAHNLTFYCFHCFYQMGPILHCPGALRHASFPAKVAILFTRVFSYLPFLGCMEKELGRI